MQRACSVDLDLACVVFEKHQKELEEIMQKELEQKSREVELQAQELASLRSLQRPVWTSPIHVEEDDRSTRPQTV